MMPIDHMLGPRRRLGALQSGHRFADPNDSENEYMRQWRRGFIMPHARTNLSKGGMGLGFGVGFNRRPGFMGRPIARPFGRGVRFQHPMFGGQARLSTFATRFPRYRKPLSPTRKSRDSIDPCLMPRYRFNYGRHSWPSVRRGYPPPRSMYGERYSFPASEYDDDEDIFGEDNESWLHSDTDDDWAGSDYDDDDKDYHDDYYSQFSPYNTYNSCSGNYASTYRDPYDTSYGSGYGYGSNTDQQHYTYQNPYQSRFRYRSY